MKLLRASGAFAFGIGLERFFASSPTAMEIALIAVAITALVVVSYVGRRYFAATLLIAIISLGLIRGGTGVGEQPRIPWEDLPRNEERVTMEGSLLTDPVPSGGRVRLRLQLNQNETGNHPVFIDAYTERLHDVINGGRRSTDFRYGDAYRVSGRFITTPDRQGVAGLVSIVGVDLISTGNGNWLRSRISSLRAEISHSLANSLDGKTAGLAAALLVGDRTRLHSDTITEFRASGLSHVLAISGLHIAMVGGLVLAVSVWVLGRQRQVYLIAPGISVWVYAALAGFSPSVTRAAIMFSVYLLARSLGRQRSVLPPLAFAAAVMLALDPSILESISFQLSFAAVLGIALISGRIAGRSGDAIQNSPKLPGFTRRPLIGLAYGAAVSLAATLATAPLVAFHFGEVPIWGLPSTLLVVPVLPVFIGGAAISAIVTSILGSPLSVAGIIPHAVGNYVTFVASFFEGIPVGPVNASGWSMQFIVCWYAVLFVLLNRQRCVSLGRKLLEQFRSSAVEIVRPGLPQSPASSRNAVFVGAIWILIAASGLGYVATRPATGELTATFFETNRGDMILVETVSGKRLLVDAGDDPDLAVANLESVLPHVDRKIDVVLSTHPDADHLGGLQRVVEQFDVGTVVDSGVEHDSKIYESWRDFLDSDADYVTAVPGMTVRLDSETTITILQTDCLVSRCSNFNDRSVVTRLEYNEISILLTGDITASAEADLIATGERIESTVLKVGHHGSRTSTSSQFLDRVEPALAVVTTGIKNQFGHPHEDVMVRLHDRLADESVYVTRNDGTVTLKTDGERLWVSTGR